MRFTSGLPKRLIATMSSQYGCKNSCGYKYLWLNISVCGPIFRINKTLNLSDCLQCASSTGSSPYQTNLPLLKLNAMKASKLHLTKSNTIKRIKDFIASQLFRVTDFPHPVWRLFCRVPATVPVFGLPLLDFVSHDLLCSSLSPAVEQVVPMSIVTTTHPLYRSVSATELYPRIGESTIPAKLASFSNDEVKQVNATDQNLLILENPLTSKERLVRRIPFVKYGHMLASGLSYRSHNFFHKPAPWLEELPALENLEENTKAYISALNFHRPANAWILTLLETGNFDTIDFEQLEVEALNASGIARNVCDKANILFCYKIPVGFTVPENWVVLEDNFPAPGHHTITYASDTTFGRCEWPWACDSFLFLKLVLIAVAKHLED